VRILLAALLLTLIGCSAQPPPAGAPPRSWLGMDPGDVRSYEGPGGPLVLLVADETYWIHGRYASALIWKHGSQYTTDYWLQDDDGTVWWYGRKGSWRAGRHGASPRRVAIADDVARFGDRSITLSDDGPVQLETPDGIYR